MKKLFKLLSIVFFVLLISGIGYSANTIKFLSHTVDITDIDSDWLYSATLTGVVGSRVHILSIQFNPGAADDQCVILDATDAGPAIFDVTSESVYDQRIKYFNQPSNGFMPFLDFSAGTYTAGSKIIIIFGR
jgi:hypothetical protein